MYIPLPAKRKEKLDQTNCTMTMMKWEKQSNEASIVGEVSKRDEREEKEEEATYCCWKWCGGGTRASSMGRRGIEATPSSFFVGGERRKGWEEEEEKYTILFTFKKRRKEKKIKGTGEPPKGVFA
ncbi:unnamed protein product [Linum tenue]|uniref:Uncharacterized protein n=1 Tax=Linum tenue TaxID=586396 RepID=A0AAV0RSK1_9ROSI|nr:unnamed protein product [Linum tenue]